MTETACYLSFKGYYMNPAEVGLVHIDRKTEEVLTARVFYGKVYNIAEMKKTSNLYHGICVKFLDCYGMATRDLLRAVQYVIAIEWKPNEIVVSAKNEMACRKFLQVCNIDLPLRTITLPFMRHDHFQKEDYHTAAGIIKKRCVHLCEGQKPRESTRCCISQVHQSLMEPECCSLYVAMEMALSETFTLLSDMMTKLSIIHITKDEKKEEEMDVS